MSTFASQRTYARENTPSMLKRLQRVRRISDGARRTDWIGGLNAKLLKAAKADPDATHYDQLHPTKGFRRQKL